MLRKLRIASLFLTVWPLLVVSAALAVAGWIGVGFGRLAERSASRCLDLAEAWGDRIDPPRRKQPAPSDRAQAAREAGL